MRRTAPILATLASAFAVATAWPADALVFSDGRELVVEDWQIRGEWIDVGLPGGGRMSLPAGGVEGVRKVVPAASLEDGPDLASSAAWREWAGEFADVIDKAAHTYEVEPALLAAMMRIESNFDPYAVSPKGACGLLQLIPATAERFGVGDVFDPHENVHGGARYLQWLLARYDGDTRLALAAYNAGENAVDRYGDVPPYRETREYVRKVLGKLDLFSSSRPVARLSSAR
jgi:hypothetical protein